ncbi:hypothetical protein LCGC14_2130920 [marine sediment metagenome]|uniref:Lipoprotein n=1 Tax=marine sediment metagenome TaxID=412755 RepID=A0A0F9E1H1_9ZZZZ
MRERMRILVVPIALLFVVAACATTPSGKVYQIANVLSAVGDAVADVCEQGKLSQPNCARASVAYDQATAAFHLAEGFLDNNEDAKAMRQIGVIVGFIVASTATLKELGVNIPDNILDYIDAISGGLK